LKNSKLKDLPIEPDTCGRRVYGGRQRQNCRGQLLMGEVLIVAVAGLGAHRFSDL